jgi:hypothetical protein
VLADADAIDVVLSIDVARPGLGVPRVVLDVNRGVAGAGRSHDVASGHGVAALEVAVLVAVELVVPRLHRVGFDRPLDIGDSRGRQARGDNNRNKCKKNKGAQPQPRRRIPAHVRPTLCWLRSTDKAHSLKGYGAIYVKLLAN